MSRTLTAAELMLAPDGSIYHLRLHPEQLSETVILVGDPGRVDLVTEHLERVESLAYHREFRSANGWRGHTRVTVLSTGIGAGCIDIVVNELDALANFDLANRTAVEKRRALNLIRLGTSGALQADTVTGSKLITALSLSFDNLGYFYDRLPEIVDRECQRRYAEHLGESHQESLPLPYCVGSSPALVERFRHLGEVGLTFSMPGFYAPQGRMLHLAPSFSSLLRSAQSFVYNELRSLNMEMESGSLNGLAAMLGHESITLCTAINNRSEGKASVNFEAAMHDLVEGVVGAL